MNSFTTALGHALLTGVPGATLAITIETVLAALVVLNLIGLTIAAYLILRRK